MLKINSPSHCVEVFHNLPNDNTPLSKEQREARYSASNYYLTHQKSFNQSEVLALFSHTRFTKELSDTFIQNIMIEAVESAEVFPVVLKPWLSLRNNDLVEEYLELLYANKDYKKIKEFVKTKGDIIEKLFNKVTHPPHELIDIVLKVNNHHVLDVKDPGYVIDYFKRNNDKLIDICKGIDLNDYAVKNDVIRNFLYEKIINHIVHTQKEKYHFTHNDEPDFVFFIKLFDYGFVEKFIQKKPEYFSQQLAKDIKVSTKKIVSNESVYTCNLLQFLVWIKTEEGFFNFAQKLIEENLHLIFKPYKENLFTYEAHVDPIEFHLRKKQLAYVERFAFFFDSLGENQKHMVVASIFENTKKVLDIGIPYVTQLLDNIPNDYIKKHFALYDPAQSNASQFNEAKDNAIKRLILKKELDEDLTPKNKKTMKKI